ncbi:hypothetical protein SAMN05444159_1163 [Bradyrhizobium lablabi]|uniref:Uncharacterized protein n=1 Tax=Bradyrhizobium lablabi TaxID=722472 RepID=A0A1M6L447_9BRAD|nr:hypothetical protein [Bradyrhizobium lablabi]SHJ65933.1 hypothetical protein SAMN05444159_1163 [Bradyrhizobium lablabi]
MTIKANGRSALILAAGLLVGLAGPSQAEPASTDDSAASTTSENAAGAPMALNKYTKHSSHPGKSFAHKSSKTAQKPAADQKADAAASADGDNSSASAAMPPSVANANASLASADTATASNAKAMSARANDIVQSAPDNGRPAAETQIVAADQLNDVDRALQAPAPATASAEPTAAAQPPAAQPPAAAPAAPVMASSSESSTWDQTSLIGKIFIGFGALLTMASAARMFMA